jgi:anti-sigma regulatory factor (Ser/Thr protein kinase)
VRPPRGDWAAGEPWQRVPYGLRPGVAGPRLRRSVTVLHHPSSAAQIRRELAADLSGHAAGFPPELLDDAAAVVTELVGNAVRHAQPLDGDMISVDWQAYRHGLEIAVTDGGSPQVPTMRVVGPEAVHGRGLAIVATLAAQWGVTTHDRGRCVWAWLGQASQVAS